MKYLIISLLFLQTVCVLQTASLSLRASRNAAFDEWLSHLDPSIKGEERSALCTNAPDGFYTFPGECTADYYVCSGGTQYNLTCSDGNVFEPATQTCVNPAVAPCKTTTSPTTPSTTKTTVKPFTCGADGNYPVGSCTPDYYICVNGNLYPQSCPSGVFNPQTSTCSSAEAAGCTTTSTPPPTTPFSCKEDGNYAAGDCLQMYYTCIAGTQYNETCPGSSVFYEGKCVAPENNPLCPPTTLPASTTTASTSTTTTRPSTTTVTTITTPTTTTTTTTPTTTKTTTTVRTTTPTTTPPTTTTPTTTKTTTTASTTTAKTTTALPPFTCPEENGFYPLGPDVCSADYYSCVGGAVYVKVCPAGIFDPVYKRCVLPENASPTCYIPPTTTTTTTTTTTPPPPFDCPGPGQYPVQGSCTLYYVCTSTGSFVASCPVGQVFNPTNQFCEPPGNVAGCNYNSFIDFYRGIMRKIGLWKAFN